MAKRSQAALAKILPMGHGCLVNTQTPLPPGWHASVFPDGWDFEHGYYPDPNLKQVGWVLLPERFYMILHWPELKDGRSQQGGAVIITFEVLGDALEVRDISGVDMDMERWIGHLVQEFPPENWKQFAAFAVTRLLLSEGSSEVLALPEGVATAVTEALREGVDLRKRGGSEARVKEDGKRHRITEQHLEDVSRVYVQASQLGNPPTRAVADHFGVAHSTAAKWVGAARRSGLLEPVPKGARPKG